MAKLPPPELVEPLLTEPELLIPGIVTYKGIETARGIQQIYDEYNKPPPREEKRHIYQPVLRGSPLPPPPVSHRVSASSGGVVIPEEDDLPRRADGEIDYAQIQSGISNLRRRMNRVADDIKESGDRLDILGKEGILFKKMKVK